MNEFISGREPVAMDRPMMSDYNYKSTQPQQTAPQYIDSSLSNSIAKDSYNKTRAYSPSVMLGRVDSGIATNNYNRYYDNAIQQRRDSYLRTGVVGPGNDLDPVRKAAGQASFMNNVLMQNKNISIQEMGINASMAKNAKYENLANFHSDKMLADIDEMKRAASVPEKNKMTVTNKKKEPERYEQLMY